MAKTTNELRDVADAAVRTALKKGAAQASGRAYRVREVQVTWRDGKLEKIHEATTRGVGVSLYVDGRYSTASSSDLRPEALETFIGDAVTLTKTLARDPFRSLPDPKLYEGQAAVDLKLEDPKYAAVTPEERRRIVKEIEAAARSVKGSDAIISVTTDFSDTLAESWRVASNGFSGGQRGTTFYASAQVSVKEADGRKPEDYAYAGARFFGELPDAASVGREASERTIRSIGSKKVESAVLTMVLENRSAGRMAAFLQGPLSGASIQQKRSFYEGKLGQAIGSPLLTVTDDPLLAKGFGSRLFDGEGLAARAMPVFEAGVLRNYFIDTYYGKKLGVAPTTGGMSNARWALGTKGRAELVKGVEDGIFVTSFLGGNSNGTTGDFSLGVRGFRIRKGELAEPVSEMNISGNHLEFWKRLVAVGNDPYPYSTSRTPTLVFDGVQFAGV
ncbi:MAG TPA: TldD/PmbA family protein [Thermoanaerobaculia bacterium]|nr:TldD/PmbA family protein [Thermoanaerobaculia bacterium]HQR66606.1 TldD/PmbA family protein [Thermoanaerobaculia bacterium]